MNWRVTLAINVAIFCMLVNSSAVRGMPYALTSLSDGTIRKFVDYNGDADALDAGESVLWASTAGASYSYLTWTGSNLLAVDFTNNVIRSLSDQNGDGDALDAGEDQLWATGFSLLSGLGRRDTEIFASDANTGEVFLLSDNTGDGDALDAGEKTVFAAGFSNPNGIAVFDTELYLVDSVAQQVFRLQDLTGDGDALDAGELLSYTPNTLGAASDLMSDGSGGLYVSSSTDATIYHVEDRTSDGDALDPGEVLSYADNVTGGPLSGPVGLAAYLNGLLAADLSAGKLVFVQDINGDSDALDVGESVLWADNLVGVFDIAIVEPTDFLAADFEEDFDVDGDDLSRWKLNYGLSGNATHMQGDADEDLDVDGADFLIWQRQFGMTGGLPANNPTNSTAVPEPTAVGLLALGLACLPSITRH